MLHSKMLEKLTWNISIMKNTRDRHKQITEPTRMKQQSLNEYSYFINYVLYKSLTHKSDVKSSHFYMLVYDVHYNTHTEFILNKMLHMCMFSQTAYWDSNISLFSYFSVAAPTICNSLPSSIRVPAMTFSTISRPTISSRPSVPLSAFLLHL